MSIGSRILASAIAATLVAGIAATTAQAAEKEWEFEVMPYLWGASIDADMVIRTQPVAVDIKFKDLFDALEIGGGLLMRAERSHWVLWTQVDYFALSTTELDNPPENGKLDVDTTLLTAGFGREFESSDGRRSIDVLLGARYMSMDRKLRFETLGTFSGERSYTDPVIILRPSFQISERWRLNPTFSYGDGGDSDSTYELQPQFEFQMTEHSALRFGYRKLHYKIENSTTGNSFDGAFQGPIIGVSGTFGGSPEPVAAPPPPPPVVKPAPPPPPPSPPPPGDSDKDGVTDDKDRCPGTPAGVVVDSIGCFKEITLRGVLFEFDSAALTAEARGQLDGLVADLRTRPADIVAGTKVTIEGHTDSVGSDAYNQGLSERRANSVRQHFTDAGLSPEMVVAVGAGEGSPVDTNDTDEGRHNNRRVVIKATR